MAHRRLIGDASASAASEKPDLVVSAVEPGIEDPGGTVTFGAREVQIFTAVTGIAPLATDRLEDRLQWRPAGGPARKRKHKLRGMQIAAHLKLNRAEQPTTSAWFELPLACQFVDV